MDNSNITFTDEEKRFVLAEIIKTSRLDVNTLAHFIAGCGVQPHPEQWMVMQVPQGRTPSQCDQVARRLLTPTLKRKWSQPHASEAGPDKRLASTAPRESSAMTTQHSNMPLASAGPVPILPRPAVNGARTSPRPSPPPSMVAAPKKRGRPSRADRAKDLRPQLPQHLAPRPPDSKNDASDRRSILPAPTTPHENTPYSPIPSLRNSAGSNSSSRSHLHSNDVGRPRVLSDGALDHIHSAHLYLKGSELPHFDPDVESNSELRSHQRELTTTLAPILQLEPRSTASAATPSQAVHPETMSNSA